MRCAVVERIEDENQVGLAATTHDLLDDEWDVALMSPAAMPLVLPLGFEDDDEDADDEDFADDEDDLAVGDEEDEDFFDDDDDEAGDDEEVVDEEE